MASSVSFPDHYFREAVGPRFLSFNDREAVGFHPQQI